MGGGLGPRIKEEAIECEQDVPALFAFSAGKKAGDGRGGWHVVRLLLLWLQAT